MSKRSIVHIEIPAADRKASAKFYSSLFGWETQHVDEMNYSMFESGNIGGGYPEISDNSPAGQVVVYIDSPDIDADLRNIEKAGGKTVMPRTEIPGFGWFALFNDPVGNTLALYTSMPR
jgi:predicted enzyme related to lactoylglutathione lyase